MTELAAEGSVGADAPPAGNPENAQTGAENGSAAPAAKSWLDGLSEGNRKLAETKGWKTEEDADKVLTSYAELERLQGEAVRVPGQDAKPEEWNAFYAKLPEPMRPVDAPDKIKYTRPDDLPPDLPYSEELANGSKQWAVDAGLNQKQAQVIHDKFLSFQAQQTEAMRQAVAQSVVSTNDELVKAWGPKDSDGFKQEHELANRSAKKLGLVEAFKESGILLPDGSLTNPQVAKALAAVGKAMFREDAIEHGAVPTGVNPWKKDTENLTQQSAIKKSDPSRARRLIREAGKDPASYGL